MHNTKFYNSFYNNLVTILTSKIFKETIMIETYTSNKPKQIILRCPECNTTFRWDKDKLSNYIVDCPHCGYNDFSSVFPIVHYSNNTPKRKMQYVFSY